jgi:hypothetical protein
MNQKVSVVFPTLLTIILVILMFFYFRLNIQYFGIRNQHQAQEVLLKAHLDKSNQLPLDTATLNHFLPVIQSDSILMGHYLFLMEGDTLK